MRSCPRTGAATLKWRKHRSLLGISNIIRNTPCGFQMEMQMEYSLEKNVSISSDRMVASDSVSLPRLDNPTGACPTHRRQWADFLVPIRDTHKSPTNCLPECGHDPWSAPNLERHGSSKMQPFGWLEMPYFLNRIFHLYFHMKSPSVFLIILLTKAKHGRELFVCINVARGL